MIPTDYDTTDRKLLLNVIRELEAACEKIAAGRTDDMYHDMINAGQSDDLLALDVARRNARAVLALSPHDGKVQP